jgi:hypothetical protein
MGEVTATPAANDVRSDAMNPLGVDDRLIGELPFAIEKRRDPPIAIGWPLIHQLRMVGRRSASSAFW